MKRFPLLSSSSLVLTLFGLVFMFSYVRIGNWLAKTIYIGHPYRRRLAHDSFPENIEFLGKLFVISGFIIAIFTLFLFVIKENFPKKES